MTEHPPQAGARDHLRKLLMWPFAPVTTTIDLLVPSPLQQRLDTWRETVERRLQERDFRPEDLIENEAWVTFLMETTRYAICTHEEEKLDALRNAICGATVPATENEWDIRHIFLSRLADMRALHLLILRVLDKPELVASPEEITAAANGAKRVEFVTSLMPELAGKEPLVEVIMDDLARWHLIEGVPPTSGPRSGTRTTEFGTGFVEFLLQSGGEGGTGC